MSNSCVTFIVSFFVLRSYDTVKKVGVVWPDTSRGSCKGIIANEDKINFLHKLQKLPYKCNMAWLLQQQVFQEKNVNIKLKFLLCTVL